MTSAYGSAGTIRRAVYSLGAARAAVAGAFCVTVMMATGCDKMTVGARSGDDSSVPSGQLTDLRKRPPILFEVFGERDDPQMVPVAVLDSGRLRPIRLTADGWHNFDRVYHHPGTSYTLYQDGRAVGTATVKQGMWSRPDAPLYSLPNCHSLIPLAAVSLDSKAATGITVEFLAIGTALPQARATTPLAPSAAVTLAHDVGARVADGAHIPRARLDSLDFHAVAISTGSTGDPTLVVSYIDPNAEEAAAHNDETSYLFAIADKVGTDYTPTFTTTVNGSAAHAQYRRYVDHLDLDGNGIDEIILEGWQYGGDTYPVILRYKDGQWREIFHGASSWCLDQGTAR